MASTEFTQNLETGQAAFIRASRFLLAPDSEDKPEDYPSNADYAGYFAEQSARFGWPVTFPEPRLEDGRWLFPVVRFGSHDRDGSIIYVVESWQPAEFVPITLQAPLSTPQAPESERSGMADNPDVISPAQPSGRGTAKS